MKQLSLALHLKIGLILIAAFLFSCDKENDSGSVELNQAPVITSEVEIPESQTEGYTATPAAATAELKSYVSASSSARSLVDESTLEPSSITVELRPGESLIENKVARLATTPPKADIVFSFDLTGSMGPIINNAKVNGINIMNSINAAIPDAAFAVTAFQDYSKSISFCGYNDMYGGTSDFPYQLRQELTTMTNDIQAAINGLAVSGGYDLPESYLRSMYETYSDANIQLRPDAAKILVLFGDNRPHDCGIGTGIDPGRDETAGTADDLPLEDVLDSMSANGVRLIALHNGPYLNQWATWSEQTDGAAYSFSDDAPAEFIIQRIEETFSKVSSLKLEVCTPGFEAWLTNAGEEYTDIDLRDETPYDFEIELTVPEGTEAGTYMFEIGAVADGDVLAKQNVTINVVKEVGMDIHPGGCPNPLNTGKEGVIPVALIGTSDFDVSEVNVGTLMLEGVLPSHTSEEDVATPYSPMVDKPLEKKGCHDLDGDGILDLTAKFEAQDVISNLDSAPAKGDVIRLRLTGRLNDGTHIYAEDIMWVVK